MAYSTITGVGFSCGEAYDSAKAIFDKRYKGCPIGLINVPPSGQPNSFCDPQSNGFYNYEIIPSGAPLLYKYSGSTPQSTIDQFREAKFDLNEGTEDCKACATFTSGQNWKDDANIPANVDCRVYNEFMVDITYSLKSWGFSGCLNTGELFAARNTLGPLDDYGLMDAAACSGLCGHGFTSSAVENMWGSHSTHGNHYGWSLGLDGSVYSDNPSFGYTYVYKNPETNGFEIKFDPRKGTSITGQQGLLNNNAFGTWVNVGWHTSADPSVDQTLTHLNNNAPSLSLGETAGSTTSNKWLPMATGVWPVNINVVTHLSHAAGVTHNDYPGVSPADGSPVYCDFVNQDRTVISIAHISEIKIKKTPCTSNAGNACSDLICLGGEFQMTGKLNPTNQDCLGYNYYTYYDCSFVHSGYPAFDYCEILSKYEAAPHSGMKIRVPKAKDLYSSYRRLDLDDPPWGAGIVPPIVNYCTAPTSFASGGVWGGYGIVDDDSNALLIRRTGALGYDGPPDDDKWTDVKSIFWVSGQSFNGSGLGNIELGCNCADNCAGITPYYTPPEQGNPLLHAHDINISQGFPGCNAFSHKGSGVNCATQAEFNFSQIWEKHAGEANPCSWHPCFSGGTDGGNFIYQDMCTGNGIDSNMVGDGSMALLGCPQTMNYFANNVSVFSIAIGGPVYEPALPPVWGGVNWVRHWTKYTKPAPFGYLALYDGPKASKSREDYAGLDGMGNARTLRGWDRSAVPDSEAPPASDAMYYRYKTLSQHLNWKALRRNVVHSMPIVRNWNYQYALPFVNFHGTKDPYGYNNKTNKYTIDHIGYKLDSLGMPTGHNTDAWYYRKLYFIGQNQDDWQGKSFYLDECCSRPLANWDAPEDYSHWADGPGHPIYHISGTNDFTLGHTVFADTMNDVDEIQEITANANATYIGDPRMWQRFIGGRFDVHTRSQKFYSFFQRLAFASNPPPSSLSSSSVSSSSNTSPSFSSKSSSSTSGGSTTPQGPSLSSSSSSSQSGSSVSGGGGGTSQSTSSSQSGSSVSGGGGASQSTSSSPSSHCPLNKPRNKYSSSESLRVLTSSEVCVSNCGYHLIGSSSAAARHKEAWILNYDPNFVRWSSPEVNCECWASSKCIEVPLDTVKPWFANSSYACNQVVKWPPAAWPTLPVCYNMDQLVFVAAGAPSYSSIPHHVSFLNQDYNRGDLRGHGIMSYYVDPSGSAKLLDWAVAPSAFGPTFRVWADDKFVYATTHPGYKQATYEGGLLPTASLHGTRGAFHTWKVDDQGKLTWVDFYNTDMGIPYDDTPGFIDTLADVWLEIDGWPVEDYGNPTALSQFRPKGDGRLVFAINRPFSPVDTWGTGGKINNPGAGIGGIGNTFPPLYQNPNGEVYWDSNLRKYVTIPGPWGGRAAKGAGLYAFGIDPCGHIFPLDVYNPKHENCIHGTGEPCYGTKSFNNPYWGGIRWMAEYDGNWGYRPFIDSFKVKKGANYIYATATNRGGGNVDNNPFMTGRGTGYGGFRAAEVNNWAAIYLAFNPNPQGSFTTSSWIVNNTLHSSLTSITGRPFRRILWEQQPSKTYPFDYTDDLNNPMRQGIGATMIDPSKRCYFVNFNSTPHPSGGGQTLAAYMKEWDANGSLASLRRIADTGLRVTKPVGIWDDGDLYNPRIYELVNAPFAADTDGFEIWQTRFDVAASSFTLEDRYKIPGAEMNVPVYFEGVNYPELTGGWGTPTGKTKARELYVKYGLHAYWYGYSSSSWYKYLRSSQAYTQFAIYRFRYNSSTSRESLYKHTKIDLPHHLGPTLKWGAEHHFHPTGGLNLGGFWVGASVGAYEPQTKCSITPPNIPDASCWPCHRGYMVQNGPDGQLLVSCDEYQPSEPSLHIDDPCPLPSGFSFTSDSSIAPYFLFPGDQCCPDWEGKTPIWNPQGTFKPGPTTGYARIVACTEWTADWWFVFGVPFTLGGMVVPDPMNLCGNPSGTPIQYSNPLFLMIPTGLVGDKQWGHICGMCYPACPENPPWVAPCFGPNCPGAGNLRLPRWCGSSDTWMHSRPEYKGHWNVTAGMQGCCGDSPSAWFACDKAVLPSGSSFSYSSGTSTVGPWPSGTSSQYPPPSPQKPSFPLTSGSSVSSSDSSSSTSPSASSPPCTSCCPECEASTPCLCVDIPEYLYTLASDTNNTIACCFNPNNTLEYGGLCAHNAPAGCPAHIVSIGNPTWRQINNTGNGLWFNTTHKVWMLGCVQACNTNISGFGVTNWPCATASANPNAIVWVTTSSLNSDNSSSYGYSSHSSIVNLSDGGCPWELEWTVHMYNYPTSSWTHYQVGNIISFGGCSGCSSISQSPITLSSLQGGQHE